MTLFGVVDAAYAKGTGTVNSKTQLKNSGYNSSRIGFRGVEDLGGGLKASFWLEAGVNNDDGSGQATSNNNQKAPGADPVINARNQGLTFNRRSTVSLEGSFGEVRLGRDYTPQFWTETAYDPFGTNGVGTNIAAFKGDTTGVRASNSIGYLSPSFSGVKVWVQAYMGENVSTDAAKAGDGNAFRVTYDNGPLSLALASSSTKTAALNVKNKTSNIGGSYDLGVAKLMLISGNQKDAVNGTELAKGTSVSASIPFGAFTGKVGYLNDQLSTKDKTSVGVDYALSKRTTLEANTYKVKGDANQTYWAGVRHSF